MTESTAWHCWVNDRGCSPLRHWLESRRKLWGEATQSNRNGTGTLWTACSPRSGWHLRSDPGGEKSRSGAPGADKEVRTRRQTKLELDGKMGNPERLEVRSQVMGSERKAQADVDGSFWSWIGILLEFGFYSKFNENTSEGSHKDSGMI